MQFIVVDTLQPILNNNLWVVKKGYISSSSAKYAIFSLLVGYLVMTLVNLIGFNSVSYLLVLLVLNSLVFYKIGGIEELIRWSPAIYLVMFYDMIFILRKVITIPPVTTAVYDIEVFLFGWLTGGIPLSFWTYNNHLPILDILFSLIYFLHVGFPFAMVIYLRWKEPNKFDEFMAPAPILVTISCILFLLVPVAPPWFVQNFGFEGPVPSKISSKIAVAGLYYADQALQVNFFTPTMGYLIANKFAAFPSMHVAIPGYLYFVSKYLDLPMRKILLPYLFLVSLSVVYLNHHWFVDVLGGLILSFGTVEVAKKFGMFDTPLEEG